MKMVRLIVVFAVLLGLSACDSFNGNDKRFEYSGNEKRYEFKGKVVSVDQVNHVVNINHEEIKDFMPAMTMPFTLKDEWAYEKLAPGDQVAAMLIVDGPRAWLEEIVITKMTTDSTAIKQEGSLAEATPGQEVPDYALTNQDGKAISLHDYRGKTLLLTFIYTRCPITDYCTLMSNNFAKIDQELAKQPDLYKQTHLLSVSIDPEYDTPQVLRSYGAAHTGKYSDEKFAHWEFAGGTKEQIKDIAQYFGLRYYPGDGQIIHGLRTVIIGRDGKVQKTYTDNKWQPEEVVRELSK